MPRRPPLVTTGPWGFAIGLFMVMLYRSDDAPSVGRRLIAAAAWMMDFIMCELTILRLRLMALRGWLKLAPVHARDLCP
eukprot:13864225-Heterocapsa_arctica.AAC.1